MEHTTSTTGGGGTATGASLAESLARAAMEDTTTGAGGAASSGMAQMSDDALTVAQRKLDQEEARAVSDEIVVMNHGRVEQVGTSEALIHHPQIE